MQDLCKYKGVEIVELHMMLDHIHMLLNIPPKDSWTEQTDNQEVRSRARTKGSGGRLVEYEGIPGHIRSKKMRSSRFRVGKGDKCKVA